jgi:hypothetical protein
MPSNGPFIDFENLRRATPEQVRYGPWVATGPIVENAQAAFDAYLGWGYNLRENGALPQFQDWSQVWTGRSGTAARSYQVDNSLGAHNALLWPHGDEAARTCCAYHAAWGENLIAWTDWDPGDACPVLNLPNPSNGPVAGNDSGVVNVGDSGDYSVTPVPLLLPDSYTAHAYEGGGAHSVNRRSPEQEYQASPAIAAQIHDYWRYWYDRPISVTGLHPYYAPVQFRRTRIDVRLRLYSSRPGFNAGPIGNPFTVTVWLGLSADWLKPPDYAALTAILSMAADDTVYTPEQRDADLIPNVGPYTWPEFAGPTIDENLNPIVLSGPQYVSAGVSVSSSRVEGSTLDPGVVSSVAAPWLRWEIVWWGQYRIPTLKGFPPLRQVQTRGYRAAAPAGRAPIRQQYSPRQTGYFRSPPGFSDIS